MDTPTLIIIFSYSLVIIIVLFLKLFQKSILHSKGIMALSLLTIWVAITVSGEFLFRWAGNSTCSKYLGCVDGFFGYDAFEHFLFGLVLSLIVMWLCRRFPRYSILHSERWKNFLVVISVVVLVLVFWEIAECAYDQIRIHLLHEVLVNVKLHIDLLDQPTNLDTMGDLCFGLLGSFIGCLL